MPNYTLYYFNGRGRAEILRMLFNAAGVQFNDKRFEFNEWDKYRTEMPTMTVPVLEVDGGLKMPETMAIARFLAREFSFYPKTSIEMMRCDYIADCFYEIFHDYMRYYHWKNGRFRFGAEGQVGSEVVGTNDSSYETYLQWRYLNTFNRVMPFLERTLAKENGGSSFFLGDQLLWCDMICYCFLETPLLENQSLFSNYPKILALRTRVAAHPKISAYLKSRIQTPW